MTPRTVVVRMLAIIYAIVVTFPSLLVVFVATRSVGQLQFFTVVGFEDRFLSRDDDKRDNSNLRHQRTQQNLLLINQKEQKQIENDSQRWWLPSRLAQVFFRPTASTSASNDTTAAASISVPGIKKTRLLSRSNEDDYEGRYRFRLHIDGDEGQTTDPTSTSSSWQSAYSQSFRTDVSTTVWKFHGWWARQPLSDNDADGGEADGRGDDNHKVSRLADALNQKALLQASLAPYPSSGSEASDVAGTVNVNVYQNRDLEFMVDADGLSPNCGVIAATTLNRDNSEKKDEICAIEIHEGTTCSSSSSDEVGPPFYDPTKLVWTNGSPWHIVKYISDSNGSTSSGNVIPMYNGGNGYESQDLVGRVLLVFNNVGDPIGCGILQLISDNSVVNGMDTSSASTISETEVLPTTTSTNEEGSASSSNTMEMQLSSVSSPSGSAEEDEGSTPSIDPGNGSTPSSMSNAAPVPITDDNNDSPDNAIPESALSLASGTSPASPGGEEVNPSSPISLDAPSPSQSSGFNTPAANPTVATQTTGSEQDSGPTVPDSTASNSSPTSPSPPSDSTPVESPSSNSQPNETLPSPVTTPTVSEPSAPNSAPMAEPSPPTPDNSDGSPTSPSSPSSPTSPIPIVPLPGEAPLPGQAPAPAKTPVQATAPAEAPAPAKAPAPAPAPAKAPASAKAPAPGVAPVKAPGVAPAKEPEVALPKPPTPQSLPGFVPPPNGNVIKDEIILWDYFLPIDITFSPTPTPSISLRPTMTAAPSISPAPSMSPSVTSMPSSSPSSAPSLAPTKTVMPSLIPTVEPSLSPTRTVLPSSTPTRTLQPSPGPSQEPSLGPSLSTLPSESSLPSLSPSESAMPSSEHTEEPSNNSTAVPSMDPTLSIMPTGIPVETASPNPTRSTTPSVSPVRIQTPTPKTVSPSQTPTSRPSSAPIKKPISNPPIETLPDEPEKPIIDIPIGPIPIDEIVEVTPPIDDIVEVTPPIDEIVEVTPPFDEIVEVTAPFDEIVEVTPP